MREQLISSICSSGKLQYSEESVKVLNSIVVEREYVVAGDVDVVGLVRATIKNM